LTKVPDGSLGGIVLLQVIEHITAQQVVQLVSNAYDKLRPGGVLMMETVNPQSLYVFAHAFYLDPTHGQPVHPAYLTFLVRESGFSDVTIDWRSLPPTEETLQELDGSEPVVKAVNENLRRLNTLLFAPQDYALIATR
jgi:O-antigen chain-terminating methyltransferase